MIEVFLGLILFVACLQVIVLIVVTWQLQKVAALLDEEAVELVEDEGGSPLLDEALGQARRGPLLHELGDHDEEEDDLHVV